MTTRHSLFTILMMCFLISCGYQKSEVGPEKKSFNPQSQSTQVDNSEVVNPVGGGGEVDPSLQDKSYEDLLDEFYSRVVEVEYENNDENKYDTRVNYEGIYALRRNKNKSYLNLINAITEKLSDPQALEGKSRQYKAAFYINAYNFYVIMLINKKFIKDNRSIKSIKDLGTLINPYAAFTKFQFNVAGRLINLDEMEKVGSENARTLLTDDRGIDARYHFAVICASEGCPILLHEAYREDKLDAQLDYVTKAALKLKRIVDTSSRPAKIVEIFGKFGDVYEEDFKKHIIPEARGPRNFIKHYGGIDIGSDFEMPRDYDWNLNQSAKKEAPDFSGIIVNNEDKNPCESYTKDTGYVAQAICDKVSVGRLNKKFKYTVEIIDKGICVMIKADENDKRTIRIAGQVDELNKKDEQHTHKFNVSTQKFKWDRENGVLSFEKSKKGLKTKIKWDTLNENIEITQRYKTFAWPWGEKRRQRSFRASCITVKNDQ